MYFVLRLRVMNISYGDALLNLLFKEQVMAKHESWFSQDHEIVRKDTTYEHEDGDSYTVHQDVIHPLPDCPRATNVSGVTTHHSDGTSTYEEK